MAAELTEGQKLWLKSAFKRPCTIAAFERLTGQALAHNRANLCEHPISHKDWESLMSLLAEFPEEAERQLEGLSHPWAVISEGIRSVKAGVESPRDVLLRAETAQNCEWPWQSLRPSLALAGIIAVLAGRDIFITIRDMGDHTDATMLSRRLPDIRPTLRGREVLAQKARWKAMGILGLEPNGRPPLRAPHWSCSDAALAQDCELASGGVLYLDSFDRMRPAHKRAIAKAASADSELTIMAASQTSPSKYDDPEILHWLRSAVVLPAGIGKPDDSDQERMAAQYLNETQVWRMHQASDTAADIRAVKGRQLYTNEAFALLPSCQFSDNWMHHIERWLDRRMDASGRPK